MSPSAPGSSPVSRPALVGAAYAGERAIAARIRRGGSDEGVADDPLVPDFDFDGAHRLPRRRQPARDQPGVRGPAPIVFAHGVTLSSRVWATSVRVDPRRRVPAVAFDGRGHGESTVGDTGHSIDNLADDLRACSTTLDLHDAILVGHSMGGMAVQALAIQPPRGRRRARARPRAAVHVTVAR